MMMARVDQALKAEKDGETLEWKNDATPASGSVTPLARFTSNGLSCRRLRIVNAYGEQQGAGRLQVLREAGRQVEADRPGRGARLRLRPQPAAR